MKVSVEGRDVPVWDVPVRLFHWSLLACVVVAGLTGFLFPPNWLDVHVWAGAGVGALILLRLVWGVTGPTYSRFRNFTLSPSAVIAHLKDIRASHVQRDGGHNPLGAWMVVALLLTLSAIVVTGLMLLGGLFKQGPGKGVLSFSMGDLMREPHELLAFLLVALVVAHIAGVVFESRRSAEDLARAMVTGKKREGFIPARHTRAAKPVLAASVVLLGGAALAWAVVQLNSAAPFGVPTFTANATWKKECGDCHMAFHPTLLPAQSWAQIMSGLDDHFGEDASLPEAKVQDIAAFLAANAAETSDSFAANRFRQVNKEHPLEITATPFWVRRHDGIADAVFKAEPIKSKQNCAACHGDAEAGAFAPQTISIPQETTK